MFQSISSRSLTGVDENGSGDIDISLSYRRRGSVSSCLRSYKTDTYKRSSYWLLCHRVCKSVSGPIFGLCYENLSVVVQTNKCFGGAKL